MKSTTRMPALVAALVLSGLGWTALAQTGGSATPAMPKAPMMAGMMESDKHFVMKAMMHSNFEMLAAEMAIKMKAPSAEVTRYAQMLVRDHTAANRDLMAVATKMGMADMADMMMTGSGTKAMSMKDMMASKHVTAEHRMKLETMEKMTGAEMQATFLKEMQASHALDLALFTGYRDLTKMTDLKGFISKQIPVLRTHHDMAVKLMTDMGMMKK